MNALLLSFALALAGTNAPAVHPAALAPRVWEAPDPPLPLDSGFQARSPYLAVGSRLSKPDSAAALYGLAFDVSVGRSGWPGLTLPAAIGIGRHMGNADFNADYVKAVAERANRIGAVRVPETEAELSDEEADWAHNTMRYALTHADGGPARELALTVSRLTPAVLIETDAERLDLFCGALPPTRMAFAAADGVRQAALRLEPGRPAAADDEDGRVDLSGMREGWTLFWWGDDSPHLSLPYPYSYPPYQYARNEKGQPYYSKHFVPADCPILVVWGRNPEALWNAGDGILFDLGENSAAEPARCAVLPLYGLNHPSGATTAAWADGLPAEVVAECAWWAARLGRYPLSVRETYALDRQNVATVTEEFTFRDLRKGGGCLAPLPPMLALARDQGLDLRFSGAVEQRGCVTAVGPAAGIPDATRYTWSFPDLSRYALERLGLASDARPAPPELQGLLVEEVEKTVSAGRLAPWLAIVHDYALDGGYYFLRTGDTLRHLGGIVELLPRDLAEKVKAHLKAEREACPPETCLSLPVFAGARRERWPADETLFGLYAPDPSKVQNMVGRPMTPAWERVPVGALYGLWAGLYATGEKPDDRTWDGARAVLMATAAAHDWATLGWFAGGAEPAGVDGDEHVYRRNGERHYGGVMAANSYFAGLVGFIRLARLRGDAAAEAFAWGLLSRTAALRFAQGKFTAYLYDAGALRIPEQAARQPDWMLRPTQGGWAGYLWAFDWTLPAHDVRQVVCLDEKGAHLLEGQAHYRQVYLTPFLHIAPELGRFLRDRLCGECDAYFRRCRENFLDWYAASMDARMGGDRQHFRFPSDAYQLFMERAWVAGESADALAGWLDVPWTERGDLFFIERVAETIRAYRGAEWVPVE